MGFDDKLDLHWSIRDWKLWVSLKPYAVFMGFAYVGLYFHHGIFGILELVVVVKSVDICEENDLLIWQHVVQEYREKYPSGNSAWFIFR